MSIWSRPTLHTTSLGYERKLVSLGVGKRASCALSVSILSTGRNIWTGLSCPVASTAGAIRFGCHLTHFSNKSAFYCGPPQISNYHCCSHFYSASLLLLARNASKSKWQTQSSPRNRKGKHVPNAIFFDGQSTKTWLFECIKSIIDIE